MESLQLIAHHETLKMGVYPLLSIHYIYCFVQCNRMVMNLEV